MSAKEAYNYDMLKAVLLNRYYLTEKWFKRKYKKCRPDTSETFGQFTSHMKKYFTTWLDVPGTDTC